MTLVIEIPGVVFTDKTLPVLVRDALISSGTRFLYDFSNPYSWESQANPADGSKVSNLVSGGAQGTVYVGSGQTIEFVGGGFRFDKELLEGVVIPDSAGMLAASNAGFIYTVWVKHLAQTANNNQALIAGNAYGTGLENQYSCSYVWSDNTYRMTADSTRPGTIILAVNEIAQLSIAYLPDGAGGFKVRGYKNGVKVGTDSATAPPLNVPVTAGRAAGIGNSLNQSSLFSHDWTGVVFRTWLEDISISQPTAALRSDYADAQVAKDYANNTGRFS